MSLPASTSASVSEGSSRTGRRIAVFVGVQLLALLVCLVVFSQTPPTPPMKYAITSVRLVEWGVSRPETLPLLLGSNFTMGDPPVIEASFEHVGDGWEMPWSIMLPRFGNAVEVSINGQVILDTRLDPEANRHLQNPSVIAIIPSSLLRVGSNKLEMRLFVWGPLRGYLDKVFVGPDPELRPAFRLRNFLFSTMPLIFKAWQAILALILGIMWFHRRHDIAYGILACAMGLGVLQGFASTPLSVGLNASLDVLAASTAPLEAALMFVFVALYFERPLPRWTPLLFLPAIFMAVASLFGDPALLRWMFALIGLPSGLIIVLLSHLLIGRIAIQNNDSVSLAFSGAITIVLLAWIYDALVAADVLNHGRIFMARLSYSVLLVAIGAGLTWRFAFALNEVDGFALRMVGLVREAEEKVRDSFVREEERSRAMTLAAERARLMRDLHDGLGGQLMSIVALSERGAEGERINQAARAALRELRLVIDAMDDMGGDLMLALGSWRERVQAQLRSHGIQLDWQAEQQGLPLHPELRPWHVIQIIRILDEAVTNAARHSGATRVLVRLGCEIGPPSSGGWISVTDDGRGMGPRPYPPAIGRQGRGLANMRTRATMCGARLDIFSAESGTIVRLELPETFPVAPH